VSVSETSSSQVVKQTSPLKPSPAEKEEERTRQQDTYLNVELGPEIHLHLPRRTVEPPQLIPEPQLNQQDNLQPAPQPIVQASPQVIEEPQVQRDEQLTLEDFADKLPEPYYNCLQLAVGLVDKLTPGIKVPSNDKRLVEFKSTVEAILSRDPRFAPIKKLATQPLPESATARNDRKQEILRQAQILAQQINRGH